MTPHFFSSHNILIGQPKRKYLDFVYKIRCQSYTHVNPFFNSCSCSVSFTNFFYTEALAKVFNFCIVTEARNRYSEGFPEGAAREKSRGNPISPRIWIYSMTFNISKRNKNHLLVSNLGKV